MVENRKIVVLKEIKRGICFIVILTKQFACFSQYIAHNRFSPTHTAESNLQLVSVL
jgi:hypothetical protein